MNKQCNACGATSPSEAKFCRKCGKQDFNYVDDFASIEINEDEFYEQAWLEVEDNKQIKKIWAKAFVQGDGNQEKTKVIYLKLRIDDLIKEEKEKISLQNKERSKPSEIFETENQKAQKQLAAFLKKNAIHITKQISETEYIVGHQSSPMDSKIKYENNNWRIV